MRRQYIAFTLQDDVADGPYSTQEWDGMTQTTPIISGGIHALRLPAFFVNLGHSTMILTAGGGGLVDTGLLFGIHFLSSSCASTLSSRATWSTASLRHLLLSVVRP